MKKYPNIINVSGNSRNVGKTALICNMIERFSKSESIVAIKFSPHFHSLTKGLILLKDTPDCKIALETDANSNKDTSKFLQAGASESFLVQCTDSETLIAFHHILFKYHKNQQFIIESKSLNNHIKVGISIYVTNELDRQSQDSNFSKNKIYLNAADNFSEFTGNMTIKEKSKELLIT